MFPVLIDGLAHGAYVVIGLTLIFKAKSHRDLFFAAFVIIVTAFEIASHGFKVTP